MKFQREYLYGNPSGQCAILSTQLWHKLNSLGINVKLVIAIRKERFHVFLLCDNRVIDVTCGQYKSAKTTFFCGQPPAKWYWKIKKTFDSPSQLIDYLRKQNCINQEIPQYDES